MAADNARIASCSCGQLTLRATGEPLVVGVCHCYACQRRTGSAFGLQARFPRSAVVIEGTSTEYVRIGDEGTHATFRFCPQCGATLYLTNAASEDSISIPVGAFADRDFPLPTVSVYEERMHAWLTMPENMKHIL